MHRVNNFIGGLADIVQQRSMVLLAALLPLVVLGFYGAFQIGFDDGMRSAFASDRKIYTDYEKHIENFAQNETNVAILVSSPNPLVVEDLVALREFAIEAQFVEGAEAVFSIFSLQHFAPDSGALTSIVPDDFETLATIEPILNAAHSLSYAGVKTLSDDFRQTFIVLSLEDEMNDLSVAEESLAEVRDLVAEFSEDDGLTFAVTGMLPIREGVIVAVKRDQLLINAVGALLAFILALALFRNVWIALANSVAPVIALVFCLGIFGWLGLSIDVVTNTLPVLVLVLASSDCTHLTFEIRRNIREGQDVPDAITSALRDVGPPCVLTSLTTVVAFASLFYSDSPIIQNLALCGAGAVSIAVVTILVIHPLIFALASRLQFFRNALASTPAGLQAESGGGVFSLLLAHHRKLSVFAVVLCIAMLALMLPVQTKYRFLENIDAQSDMLETLSEIEGFSGPINAIELTLSPSDDHAPTDPAVLADVQLVHEALEAEFPGRSVISVHTLVRFLEQGDGTITITDVVEELPERFRNRLISVDGANLMVSLATPDVGAAQIRAEVNHIEMEIADLGLDTVVANPPSGFLVMTSFLSDSMIRQLTISFLMAAVVCSTLIGLWYGSVAFAIAAVVPNLLPIAAVGAWLTFVDSDIQFTTALALTIAFGIALDDSIHVFNRLWLQKNASQMGLTRESIVKAMTHIMPALVTTTAILSAGMLASQISNLPLVRFFGILCIVTFVLALVADLFLLPAIVASIGKNADEQDTN